MSRLIIALAALLVFVRPMVWAQSGAVPPADSVATPRSPLTFVFLGKPVPDPTPALM